MILKRPSGSLRYDRWRFASELNLLHRLRYCLFVISREDNFQFFSAVPRQCLERKNAESLLMAYVEVAQAPQGEIRDDGAEGVQVSGVLARRRFLLRN
jgi:hypothetical protein